MYGLSDLLGSERFGPISFRVPQRPDLGDDPQLLWIRMQRFFDKLIGYVRPIEVAGVDVGDTELNNLAQDREGTVMVCWRPEYMRTSQLHGTVPHASKDQVIGKLDCASWQCCRRRTLPFGFHVRVCHCKPRRWRCHGMFIRARRSS
jgi:hypothetical protein